MIVTVALCLILFLKVQDFIRATKIFKYLKECLFFFFFKTINGVQCLSSIRIYRIIIGYIIWIINIFDKILNNVSDMYAFNKGYLTSGKTVCDRQSLITLIKSPEEQIFPKFCGRLGKMITTVPSRLICRDPSSFVLYLFFLFPGGVHS